MREVAELPCTGDVFWCEQFPGLHGHAAKDRYAVVVSPHGKLPDTKGNYLVVPTSESSLSTFAVRLPSLTEYPQTSSGLPNPCVAVCDEFRFLKAEQLTRWVGDLRTPTVHRIQKRILEFIHTRKPQ